MTTARAFYRVTKGKNSPFNIFIEDGGFTVSSDGVTRCDLNFIQNNVAGPVISSSVDPTFFTLQFATTLNGVQINAIRVDLKDATLNPGRYEVEVFVYDAVSTDGRFAGTLIAQIDGPLSTPIGALPMDLFGNLRFPVDTPATLTANVDDYSPGSNAHSRLASDATRTISGIAFIADGQLRVISNVGSNKIVFAHESTSSLAANRFITQRAHDFTLYSGDTIEMIYDGVSNRWRIHPPTEPYYRRTAAELAQGVVPKNTICLPGDIRRYGAAVDGTTDDAAAWQDAIDQSIGVGGAPVIWLGDSAVDSTLTINDHVTVLGSGRGKSIVRWTGGAFNLFEKVAAGQYDNLLFRDFEAIDDGDGVDFFDLDNVILSHFENVFVDGFVTGFNINNSSIKNTFVGVRIDNCTYGYFMSAVPSAFISGQNFIACEVANASIAGWRIEELDRNSLVNCLTISCTVGVILIGVANFNTVIGMSFDSNTTDWQVGASCVGNMFIGGKYDSTPVVVDNGTDTMVLDTDGKLTTPKAIVNVNTPSGATAQAFPIYDSVGVLIGYIPVYAAQW